MAYKPISLQYLWDVEGGFFGHRFLLCPSSLHMLHLLLARGLRAGAAGAAAVCVGGLCARADLLRHGGVVVGWGGVGGLRMIVSVRLCGTAT